MLLMTSVQKATLTLDPRDAKGHPAALDGAPSWTVADPTVATVEVADDGLSAVVVAQGVGVTQVNVVADAKIGPEVKELAGVLEVQVSAAEAVTLGISASTPEDQA